MDDANPVQCPDLVNECVRQLMYPGTLGIGKEFPGTFFKTGCFMGKMCPLHWRSRVHRVVWMLAVAWVLLPERGFGQGAQDRYQLGRRLERFERAWQEASVASRARSTASMEQAVESFFSLQLGRAGKSLDRAWLQVTGVEESEQAERLGSIRWKLDFEKTLLDVKDPVVVVRASVFYDQVSASDQADNADNADSKLEIALSVWPWSDARAPVSGAPVSGEPLMRKRLVVGSDTPFELDFGGLSPGDYLLEVSMVGAAQGTSDWICPSVSLVDRMEDRFGRMERWIEAVRRESAETSKSTAKFLARELGRGRKGTSFEIDLPWNRLLSDFEQITAPKLADETSIPSGFTTWLHKPGWKWMQLSRGKSTQVVRMEVPEFDAEDPGLKLPVLIALHGAGGSENMFFQTYGAGRLIELGRQRGWIIVSPRQTMTGLGLDVGQMVEALSEILPVDQSRVMLVGHSMGAAQAMAQVSNHPGLIRSVAALGGGGVVRNSEAIRKVPFYVGAGDRDFGKSRAKSLSKELERIGCEVEYREYIDVEHMVIVQAALDDVFAFFDKRLR